MRIHFIGIGGIGVSALAQYYLAKGHEISGSDLESSEITEFLDKKGIKVFIGQKPENVSADLDLIIYSPAVPQDNPEFKKAKELGVRMKSYPGALGELTEQHYTIAVSGSHGKSTTTAMVGLILERAGFDPTVIVGTKLKEFGNFNFRAGKSKYLVIEACEYDGSFLNYSPQIIVVTNVDKEHLDYFKTFSNVKKAFKKFMMRLPAGGFLVANKEDENMPKITNNQFSSFYYATNQKEADVL
ncbi:MAG: Mur ligase domain-containing protein, partial [Patescibacteria group bacterium]